MGLTCSLLKNGFQAADSTMLASLSDGAADSLDRSAEQTSLQKFGVSDLN